ncbi:MAG: hypothetical protein J3Q66DRAFT_321595 [Benniella sp.]|nr:MAG: hypothetical protein J3Q66DRAFT_321595 [Benniella sp.]
MHLCFVIIFRGPVYDPNKSAQDAKGAGSTIPSDEGGPVSLAALTPRRKNLDVATIPPEIFQENQRPPATVTLQKFPEADERIISTAQLGYLLTLLQFANQPDEFSETKAKKWVEDTVKDADEQERLKALANNLIRAFTKDELKDSKAVSEVIYLAPALEKEQFKFLLGVFYDGVKGSGLLDYHQLEGLAQLMRYAGPDYLEADDLVKILGHLNTRLMETHDQSGDHKYKLTLALCNVLDAMADAQVKGLDRKKLHEPLKEFLKGMHDSDDPYLVFRAAYASQALLFVPDDETAWQKAFRRTGKVIQGVAGLVSAVKAFDLNGLFNSLGEIQQGLEGIVQVVEIVTTAYENVTGLVESGQNFLDAMKEGFSFDQKRAWYAGLRALDTLIRDGQIATFKSVICEAPCRRDPAFQWGVCQRLGELAAHPNWPVDIRRNAMQFLAEIYKDDVKWGQQVQIKQYILDILMQLSRKSGAHNVMQIAETIFDDLEKNGDEKKQAMFKACREGGPSIYPLEIAMPEIPSPSLLDRVLNKPDVEGSLRLLKKRRLKLKEKAVYIPPQGKENPLAREEFPLMEKINDFLETKEKKVFLLMGDSGAGKSTFNKELEVNLWNAYKKGGVVPLHINLPAIDKPEHDMIAKQLRKYEFTEPEIRELKYYREFILICDGYDESQQTQNLYVANKLNQNQQSEWKAKMVISCRSEYLGRDYKDRFQPMDRNRQSETGAELFEQAVITPFSQDQINDYIKEFVALSNQPWTAENYLGALNKIPSLRDLVSNPFLLSLSLEVLPRIVDPGQHLSSTKITKVALYDQFVEQWLERGKKRLGEKELSPQAKAAFEGLTDEGFAQNGIDFLKRLAVDIYENQAGQPVVEYSRFKDEGSWKDYYFSRDDEKQLLRESCPLTRTGNQHRFIHRSLLEYSLTRAIFEPQERRKKMANANASGRRGSAASVLSFEIQGGTIQASAAATATAPVGGQQLPERKSPLLWRSFVNDSSILQFLSERVQQEPVFKQQLFEYIEKSKTDPKARTAAANSITILVRAGVQFNEMDLKGIRIPGADLSHGIFDATQLQGADMRKTKLRNVWLRKANLDKAIMTGSQFGELPYLVEYSPITSYMFSPDVKRCVAGLENGRISVYTTTKWEKTTLDGHSSQITQILFSSSGKVFATGSSDKTVRVWDVETGVCQFVLSGFTGGVGSIAFSPQGGQIAIASDDEDGKTVKLWEEETGKFIRKLSGHAECITGLAYSPEGDRLVTGSSDKSVRLWNVQSGDCLHVMEGHSQGILSVSYSPLNDQVASTSKDKTVLLWDTETGQCLPPLTQHTGEVSNVLYSSTGDRIATFSNDENDLVVRVWDTKDGKLLHSLHGHTKAIKSLAFSPKGNQLATGSADKTVMIWDVESGNCDRVLSGHLKDITTVVYAPVGEQIASCSLDQTVRLWGIEKSTGRHTSNGHSDQVTVVAHSPNVEQLISCSADKTVRLWDRESGYCRFTLIDHKEAVTCASYNPLGNRVATGSEDKTIRIWNVQTGVCDKVLEEHTDAVTAVAFAPEEKVVASGSADKTVKLWDLEKGECTHTLSKHTGTVRYVLFSPKGDQIISASDDENDKSLHVWNAASGEFIKTLTGHEGSILGVVFSPKDNQLATCSSDNTIRLWDVASGNNTKTLTGHSGAVRSIAYSSNGQSLVSGSDDGTVCVWNVATGTCSQTLKPYKDSDKIEKVTVAVFSPNGDKVASASHDQTVRVWDVATGECEAVLESFQKVVRTMDWKETPDDQFLVTGSDDHSVRLWHVLPATEETKFQVKLVWRTTHDELTVQDASIQDTRGLNRLNSQLLKQRKAIGTPVPPMTFKQAIKMVLAANNVFFKKPAVDASALVAAATAAATATTTPAPAETKA